MTNDKSLIQVTPAAIAEIKRIAQEQDKPLQLRVAMMGGGCSGFTVKMDYTKWPPDDDFDYAETIEGVKFLIDMKSALYLRGAILDFGGGLLDRGFKWDFPQATGGCGCGISFSF